MQNIQTFNVAYTVSLKEYSQFSGVCLDILQYLTEGLAT